MINENFEAMDLTGTNCLKSIVLAIDDMKQTIALRRKSKLSVSRFASVERELDELRKVLIFYSSNELSTSN